MHVEIEIGQSELLEKLNGESERYLEGTLSDLGGMFNMDVVSYGPIEGDKRHFKFLQNLAKKQLKSLLTTLVELDIEINGSQDLTDEMCDL